MTTIFDFDNPQHMLFLHHMIKVGFNAARDKKTKSDLIGLSRREFYKFDVNCYLETQPAPAQLLHFLVDACYFAFALYQEREAAMSDLMIYNSLVVFDFDNITLVNLFQNMIKLGYTCAKEGKSKSDVIVAATGELIKFDSVKVLAFMPLPRLTSIFLIDACFIAYLAGTEREGMMTGKSDTLSPPKMLPYKQRLRENEEKAYQDGKEHGSKGTTEEQANSCCTEFILTLSPVDHSAAFRLIKAWYKGFDSILETKKIEENPT